MFKTLDITPTSRVINFGLLYTNFVIIQVSIISTGNFYIHILSI